MEQSPPSSILGQISRLFHHSAIYAISTSIQRIQGLLLLPIYTNFDYISSRSEFGNYVLVYTFIAFMNFVYLYGMDSALLRYFFLGKENRKTVFSSTLIFLLLSSFLTTLIVFWLSPSIAGFVMADARLAWYIKIAALILMSDSLLNLPYLILRAEEKPVTFTVYRTLRFLIEFLLNIWFVVILRKGVLGILYANLSASLLNLVFMFPVILRYFQFKINWPLFKEMLLFGLPFLPNGIAYMTIEMVDRLLVENILGKDAVGLYGANYKFGTILLLVIVAFRNAWQPFFLKTARQENAPQIFARVLTYFVIGAGLLTILVTYFIQDLLTLRYFNKFYIFGPKYWEAIPIIPVILTSYFFFGIYVLFTPGFYIRKKSQYMILFTGSAALINIAANLILLPILNIWGAALATLLSYMTMALSIYVVSQKIYPIPVEWGRIGKMATLIVLEIALYFYLPLTFIHRLGLTILTLGVCFFYILEKEERQLLKSQVAAIFL